MAATIYTQIDSNRHKTWLIMFLFSVFVTGVVLVFAYALGYRGTGALGYAGFGLIVTGVINFFSYYYSDRMVMALSRAKQIEKKDNPELYNLVENLAIGSGLPMPKVYIVDDPSPNAFATGRNPQHASIAVHTGLLQIMNKQELEGVLAHELSHVGNYDTRLMTVVVMLVGTLALLADMFLRTLWWGGGDRDDDNRGGGILMIFGIVLAIVAPISAQLIQLAVSRRREYLADASGALLTRFPDGLADALEKIGSYNGASKTATTATAHLYIANPFGKKAGSWFLRLFSTHPPIEDRIKRLREM